MKFDNAGIPVKLDCIEYMSKFIDKHDADEFLANLLSSPSWGRVSFMNEPMDNVYNIRYTELERRTLRIDVLEEIINYIEIVLETDIIDARCELHTSQEVSKTNHNCDGHNQLILILGGRRTITVGDIEYKMSHGDALFVNPLMSFVDSHNVNHVENYEGPTVIVNLYMKTPYINRYIHTRVVNVLNVGPMIARFYGPEANVPPADVVCILSVFPPALLD